VQVWSAKRRGVQRWHVVTAGLTAGGSSQQAPHWLRGLSNSSSRAAPGHCSAPGKEPSHRSMAGSDVGAKSGRMSQEPARSSQPTGGWLVDLQLWLKQLKPMDASSPGSLPPSLGTVPDRLETPAEQGAWPGWTHTHPPSVPQPSPATAAESAGTGFSLGDGN